jgi:hypothetical protein
MNLKLNLLFRVADLDPRYFGKLDPDLHHFGKLDPNPDPHQSQKQDPPDLHPHQSRNSGAMEAQNLTI